MDVPEEVVQEIAAVELLYPPYNLKWHSSKSFKVEHVHTCLSLCFNHNQSVFNSLDPSLWDYSRVLFELQHGLWSVTRIILHFRIQMLRIYLKQQWHKAQQTQKNQLFPIARPHLTCIRLTRWSLYGLALYNSPYLHQSNRQQPVSKTVTTAYPIGSNHQANVPLLAMIHVPRYTNDTSTVTQASRTPPLPNGAFCSRVWPSMKRSTKYNPPRRQ